MVPMLLRRMARAKAACVSTAHMDTASRDDLPAARTPIDRTVPLLPESSVSTRSENVTWLLYAVRHVVRKRAKQRGGDFSSWLNGQRAPSFSYVLEVCYVLNLSPLQLMTVEPERLKKGLQSEMIYRQLPHTRYRTPASKGNVALMQQFIQSVLSGDIEPLPVRRVARHLGVGEKFLVGRFPQECAQIATHYQAYRAEHAKQRVTQECLEVRQAVLTLDKQGEAISRSQVIALLSNPHILRRPEGKATWHTICRERGLES